MNYTNLFVTAWEMIKKNRFLIVLGMLVVLGSWEGGSSASQGASGSNGELASQTALFNELPTLWQGNGMPLRTLTLIGGVLTVAVALWVLGTISRGGLIYGVDQVNRGADINFAASFQAGWKRGRTLIGIGLVSMVPLIFLFLVPFVCYKSRVFVQVASGAVKVPNALGCLLVFGIIFLLFLLFSSIKVFAERACILEGTGVFVSYRRGLQVLLANLGPASVLFLFHLAISIGFVLFLFFAGILFALCCFLWPLFWVVQGGFTAFCSALWTLAWNQWTDVR